MFVMEALSSSPRRIRPRRCRRPRSKSEIATTTGVPPHRHGRSRIVRAVHRDRRGPFWSIKGKDVVRGYVFPLDRAAVTSLKTLLAVPESGRVHCEVQGQTVFGLAHRPQRRRPLFFVGSGPLRPSRCRSGLGNRGSDAPSLRPDPTSSDGVVVVHVVENVRQVDRRVVGVLVHR